MDESITQYINGGVYAYDNGKTLILYENDSFMMFGWDVKMSIGLNENELTVVKDKIGRLVLTLPLSG